MKKILLLIALSSSVGLQASKQAPQEKSGITVTSEDVGWLMKQIQDYIVGPIFSSFVERKMGEMDIGQLHRILEKRINETMAAFIEVGKEAKDLVEAKADKAAIKEKHEVMANIFHTLRPAEVTVRAMYPKMSGLFDQLNKQYPDQYTQFTYSLDEDAKTVQAVEQAMQPKAVEPVPIEEQLAPKAKTVVVPVPEEQIQQEREADAKEVEADQQPVQAPQKKEEKPRSWWSWGN